MRLKLPEPSLVVLVGASGSGKSTFAARHFKATEVISLDFCRGLVADDQNDQSATEDAFAVLHEITRRRLKGMRLTVVDATNVQKPSRAALVQLARELDLFAVAIVLDVPEAVCAARNAARPDRDFGPHVLKRQRAQLRGATAKRLHREGFQRAWVLDGEQAVDDATVERTPRWSDHRADHGPFDVIGDVHGCRTELDALLRELGYAVDGDAVTPPPGRRAIFVGDLVDRGPDSPGVLRLVMGMVAAGSALCVPGNHDVKLVRFLDGRDVRMTHGLAETAAQLEAEPASFRDEVRTFLAGLVSHLVLDGGALVVAHAGMLEAYQGRSSGRVREFALYGATTGERDDVGMPVRLDWAADYRGRATVVHGHVVVPEPRWVNGTVDLDTGCVFGGALTALRWPERTLVSVPAEREWYAPTRPLRSASGVLDPVARMLDVEDVAGRRIVDTRLARTVTVREDQAAAALEVMSRFAIDPRWLVHLPPTMAPTATSARPDLLEHPDEAFAEFRTAGVAQVRCEEKHMGSRAIAVLCRSASVARERFGVDTGETGVVHTRTGRPFLGSTDETEQVLRRIRAAADASGLWDELVSDWVVLDAELLPWSAKAMDLVRRQYAAVGAAAHAGLGGALEVLGAAAARGLEVDELRARMAGRAADVDAYRTAYERYVQPVDGVDDLRLAPFHVLAAESGVFVDRPHAWHLDLVDRLVAADDSPLLVRTDRRLVDVTDPAAAEEATAWWTALTDAGGEGMVVKPESFVAPARRGLAQPGVKVRGREYLRIVYGPEYPAAIDRLRSRNLGRKRSLALREFGLGVESLERFVRREPLHRVHEAVFAVLALESEPVDPRL